MNITWNHEASQFTDSARYFKLVSDELGLDTEVSEGPHFDTDVVFNCESCHNFGKGKKLTAIYHIDPTWEHANNISNRIDDCDIIFSTHKDVPYKDSPKFVYLPHASHSSWLGNVEKEYDVFLPPWPNNGRYDERAEISQKIMKMFNATTVPYGTPTEEYIKQMSKCRLIFNWSAGGDVNRKIFDGMMHGVLVTNDLKGLDDLNRDLMFVTDDPVETIDYLLMQDQMIKDIDQMSTEYVLKEHTYHHRLLTILAEINKRL